MNAVKETTRPAADLAESISGLPPLPATAQKILACFGDEFIDAAKVAAVVEGDPGICARLLGLANSAYFGLVEPVNSIAEAISRVLGVDTVRSLVLAMAIQRSFDSKNCPAFSIDRFWQQSLLVAECCKRIVAADDLAQDDDRDLAYSAGLCHNLGLMALAHINPGRTNHVLVRHQMDPQQGRLTSLLHDEFGADHKVITVEISQNWTLPSAMVSAYRYRASPDSQIQNRLDPTLAAAVAAVENAELAPEQRVALTVWADALGMNAAELQEFAELSERQIERVQSLASNMTR
jgi:HD-like signal output (HDOD) protein